MLPGWVHRNWRASIGALAAACALIFLFQNCNNTANLSITSSSLFGMGGGNGDGYAGMIYTSALKCADGTPQLKVKLNSDGSGLLIKDNCIALAPALFIPVGEILIDQPQAGKLTYRDIVFEKEPTATNSISNFQYTTGNYTLVNATNIISSSPMAAPSQAGHLVVCSVHYQSPSIDHNIVSMVDNLGNNYIRAVGKTTSMVAPSYPAFVLEVWYKENINGGNSLQVSANLSGVMTGSQLIHCYEYDGIVTANALDQVRSGFGATNVSFGSFTTNWNNELVHVVHHGNNIVPSSVAGFQTPRAFPDSAGFMFINSVTTLSVNLLHATSAASVGAILTFRAKDKP